MRDARGVQIQVGDTVVVSMQNSRRVQTDVVTGFNVATVRLARKWASAPFNMIVVSKLPKENK